jgi:hypothetical protein
MTDTTQPVNLTDLEILRLANEHHAAELAGTLPQTLKPAGAAPETSAEPKISKMHRAELAALDINPDFYIEAIMAGASHKEALSAHAAGAHLIGYAVARDQGLDHDAAIEIDIHPNADGALVAHGALSDDKLRLLLKERFGDDVEILDTEADAPDETDQEPAVVE